MRYWCRRSPAFTSAVSKQLHCRVAARRERVKLNHRRHPGRCGAGAARGVAGFRRVGGVLSRGGSFSRNGLYLWVIGVLLLCAAYLLIFSTSIYALLSRVLYCKHMSADGGKDAQWERLC